MNPSGWLWLIGKLVGIVPVARAYAFATAAIDAATPNSPAPPGRRALPPAEESLRRFLAAVQVDWADATSVVDYLVDYWRVLWGPDRTFDEAHVRKLAARDVDRARNPAAAQNHGLLEDEVPGRGPLRLITAPTLVIHGARDPMFPLAHGDALATEIPGARLLALEGAGHGIDPADWAAVAGAILEHTSFGARSARAGAASSGRDVPALRDAVAPDTAGGDW